MGPHSLGSPPAGAGPLLYGPVWRAVPPSLGSVCVINPLINSICLPVQFLWTWQIDLQRPHEGDLPPIYNTNTTGFGLSAWQRDHYF